MMKESDAPKKFLWVDLEMTGLDPQSQRIIEVAAIVTDANLHEVDTFESVIHQPEEVFAAAEDWPKQHMQELFSESAQSQQSDDQVVAELAAFIDGHFDGEPAVLAGNSIHQDRRFIRQWWPIIEQRLHYRMLDVSSFKVWVQAQQLGEFEKGEKHRALADIRESIQELSWSLEQLNS